MKIATRVLAGLALAAAVMQGTASAYSQAEPQTQSPKPRSDGDQGRGFKWWKDAAIQKELALTGHQVGKIDRIFESAMPSIQAAHQEMDGLRTELSRLIDEHTAEERVVALQIDRVEALRSQINKARTLMLYRMQRVLTQPQGLTFKAVMERQRKGRSGGRR
ncbi:MAG: Spy/CpxP family protein refolding chaperone [Acidobacteriota bacterium]|nr:Spy/CpxP family protein refolding chaperone [Acidobacteriota bacterium]